jgi:hypothetical protein
MMKSQKQYKPNGLTCVQVQTLNRHCPRRRCRLSAVLLLLPEHSRRVRHAGYGQVGIQWQIVGVSCNTLHPGPVASGQGELTRKCSR